MKSVMFGLGAVLLAGGLAPAWTVGEDHVVQISAKKFQPDRIEIKAGEKVTWKNYDLMDHTVTAKTKPALPDGQGKPLFDSGVLKPGDAFSFTFDKEGTYEYECSFHKGMTGTVVVMPAK
jgi:plastocyanin